MPSKYSTLPLAKADKPRFVVLLAVFNGVAYLQEQLDSILSQENVLVEVFVSVDISSDGSERWIDAVALGSPHIHVLPHGQQFGGAAPNFFRLFRDVSFDHFDYVCLSDQDDIWLPQKLSRAHQALEEHDAQAYSSNALAFWEGGRTAFIRKSQAQTPWDYLFEAAGPGCTYVLKSALAKEIQVLAVDKAAEIAMVGLHDWFIYAYARSKGYRWHIDDQALIHYRQHAQNQVGMNSGLKDFIHRARKVSSGWALGQSALIARLIGMENVPFVRRWIDGRPISLFRLSLSFWACRRRLRDKFLFLMTCLYLASTGGSNE
jgi:rhamnosyltransferase